MKAKTGAQGKIVRTAELSYTVGVEKERKEKMRAVGPLGFRKIRPLERLRAGNAKGDT